MYGGCAFLFRCVTSELFLDGLCLFDLSQLLDYCSRLYQPDPMLKRIPDKHIRVRGWGSGSGNEILDVNNCMYYFHLKLKTDSENL